MVKEKVADFVLRPTAQRVLYNAFLQKTGKKIPQIRDKNICLMGMIRREFEKKNFIYRRRLQKGDCPESFEASEFTSDTSAENEFYVVPGNETDCTGSREGTTKRPADDGAGGPSVDTFA